MKRRSHVRIPMALVPLLLSTLAYAHVGVGETAGFARGVIHPLGGMDHVFAMIAVGLWAAQRGERALWLIPATFVLVMALGGFMGVLIVGLFAVFHGHAHGAEMPADA